MYFQVQRRTPAPAGGAIASGSESVASGIASWGSTLSIVLVVLGVAAIVLGILLCILKRKKDKRESEAAGGNNHQWYGSGGGSYQPVKGIGNESDDELRRGQTGDDRYPPMAAMRNLRSPTVAEFNAQYQDAEYHRRQPRTAA
jgi:preprotein translocase subunit SecG